MAKEHPIHQALRNFLINEKNFEEVRGDFQSLTKSGGRIIAIPRNYAVSGEVLLYSGGGYVCSVRVIDLLEQTNPLLNYFITHS